METPPIVIEHLYNAPVSKVWLALTDPEEMKQWYFDLPGFRAEKGYTFTFMGGPSPEKQYVHLCGITDVVPRKKLSYTWRYEGYGGLSLVTFELTGVSDKTVLRLTHSGTETFPEDNPDLATKNFVEGWNDIIHKSLKRYLEEK